MRIAVIASNLFKIPPEKGHAVQQVTSRLVEGLLARGHDVTLFGPGNCQTSGKLVSIVPESLDILVSEDSRKAGAHLAFDTALATLAFSKSNDFDLYHISLGSWENIVFLARFCQKPVVVTLHDPLFYGHLSHLIPELSRLKNVHFVSISNAQRQHLEQLNYTDTVYHGIETDEYEFDQDGGDYFFWLGRPSHEKGLDILAKVAKATGVKIKIAPLVWSWKRGIWEKEFAPLLTGGNIETIGELSTKGVISLYRKAKAFLFPLQWDEPFGLVMIETGSCGTPVIAFNRGSVPEVVVDGETGFIVEPEVSDLSHLSQLGNLRIQSRGIEGLVEAVNRINSMSRDEYKKMRRACRAHVEANFTVGKMIDGYERVYEKVLGRSGKSLLPNFFDTHS